MTEGGLRIQAVAERTGVPAPTLRAWERRYGVPRPVRTNSAYRVYSEQDIHDIQALQALCTQGMSVSQAALTLLNQERKGEKQTPSAPLLKPAQESRNVTYGALVEQFVTAARNMDIEGMERVLMPVSVLGSGAEVYSQVLVPVMMEIGELWRDGKISIGHEHLATELVAGAARQLLQMASPATPRYVALLSCFPEELHTIPLYGLGFHLLGFGCRSAVLGARTPPQALAAAVEQLKPDLIGLSVTITHKADTAEVLAAYSDAAGRVPWVVGGTAAQELASQIEALGGYVEPKDQQGLPALLNTLLSRRGAHK